MREAGSKNKRSVETGRYLVMRAKDTARLMWCSGGNVSGGTIKREVSR